MHLVRHAAGREAVERVEVTPREAVVVDPRGLAANLHRIRLRLRQKAVLGAGAAEAAGFTPRARGRAAAARPGGACARHGACLAARGSAGSTCSAGGGAPVCARAGRGSSPRAARERAPVEHAASEPESEAEQSHPSHHAAAHSSARARGVRAGSPRPFALKIRSIARIGSAASQRGCPLAVAVSTGRARACPLRVAPPVAVGLCSLRLPPDTTLSSSTSHERAPVFRSRLFSAVDARASQAGASDAAGAVRRWSALNSSPRGVRTGAGGASIQAGL
jgi:hypothetical protein